MKTTLSTYGRYSVVETTLTDKSVVHDVEFLADSGELMRISCLTRTAAEVVATAMAAHAVDVYVLVEAA